MVRLLVYAIIIKMVAGEMSLSGFPCYKPKPSNYRSHLRIVGGHNADPKDTPYMVGLMKNGGIVCGASIVSENFLILAGHCVCNNQNKLIKPTQLKAFIGMNKVSDAKTINEVDDNALSEVQIDKILVHPGYTCGRKAEDDIALLRLKSSIKFSERIQPLCLSTEDSELPQTGIVSGWGLTNEDFHVGVKPNILQSAAVPLWDNEECQTSYKNLLKSNKITENQLCAGAKEGGIDSCWADSGGPLVSKATGNLIGIVSTGVGCARKGLPGIYTRISRYTKWVEGHVTTF